MKVLTTVMITVITTIVTLFMLIGWFDYELTQQSDRRFSLTTAGDVIHVIKREVIHYEEAQMDAIDGVAEAIVGIIAITQTGPIGTRTGTGSGIVYAVRNGHTYIVTNEHVVEGVTELEVVFNDENQTRVPARLIGMDVYTDIAVIRIENFEANITANFGRTEDLRIGQTVIAIGNPLGLEFAGSATMGVVSGHDRSVKIPIMTTSGGMQDWAMTVLQTDTAINPGNSGGALINLAGEVVGINSMKVAQSAVEGMSFSIPTYIALPIIEDLEVHGVVTRPVLGVNLFNLSSVPDVTRTQMHIPSELRHGVFVNDVMDDSLASSMGIVAGDVVIKIGDIDILDTSVFRQALFTYREGDTITLAIVRAGYLHELKARIVMDADD
jgi:serine protease Do